ncbi:23269_t:CDS:2, partial [Racocetra persica]
EQKKNTSEESLSENNEPNLLEEKYYATQLKKAFDDLMDLHSLLDKNFISYLTTFVISFTVSVVFSVADKDSMASLSSKILSISISGIGSLLILFANIVLLKDLFTRNKLDNEQANKPDTVDKLNKEEQANKPDIKIIKLFREFATLYEKNLEYNREVIRDIMKSKSNSKRKVTFEVEDYVKVPVPKIDRSNTERKFTL